MFRSAKYRSIAAFAASSEGILVYVGPGIYVGSDLNLWEIDSAAQFAYIKSLPAPVPPPPPPPPPAGHEFGIGDGDDDPHGAG